MTFMQTLNHIPLPLWWIRLPLCLATFGLSGVCIAVAIQAIKGMSHLQRMAETNAAELGPFGFAFDMQDIMSTSIVLLVVALLIACSTLFLTVKLIQDIVFAVQVNSYQGCDEVETLVSVPVTTKTLGFQSAIQAFLTAWLFAVLIPSTVFSRTREAKLSLGGVIISPGTSPTDPIYWDYGFLRCLAAAPWFTFIFSFPATLVSIAAWRLSKVSPANARPVKSG